MKLSSYKAHSFLSFPHPNVGLPTSLEKKMNFSTMDCMDFLLTSSAWLWVYRINSLKNVKW